MARTLILALVLGTALAGCGQKGPLYFPEADNGDREEEREDDE